MNAIVLTILISFVAGILTALGKVYFLLPDMEDQKDFPAAICLNAEEYRDQKSRYTKATFVKATYASLMSRREITFKVPAQFRILDIGRQEQILKASLIQKGHTVLWVEDIHVI